MGYPPPLPVQQQDNVRRAVVFLGMKLGTWAALSRALRMRTRTIRRIRDGQKVPRYVAQRVAALVAVPVDDVIAGRFPATDACPRCGCTIPGAPT